MGRVMVEKKGLQLVRLEEQADAFGNIAHQPVYEEGYLAGAVFELRAAEDIVGKDGTVWFHAGDVADTITTTEAGKDASKELPLGRYELVEVSAPEGYLLDGAPHEVELRYENDHTAVVETNVTLGNDYLSAEITLEKEKEDLEIIMDGDHVRQALVNTPGEGFVFGLFADEDTARRRRDADGGYACGDGRDGRGGQAGVCRKLPAWRVLRQRAVRAGRMDSSIRRSLP